MTPVRPVPPRARRLRQAAALLSAASLLGALAVGGLAATASAQTPASTDVAQSARHLAGAQSGGSEGTTITGTVSGDHAWDPKTGKPVKAAPSVTVDQTQDLTDQVVQVSWKNFTPSSDLAGNFYSQAETYYAVSVLQCRGLHPRDPRSYRWPDFGPDCYPFTSDNANAEHGTGNQAYTLTGADGTGSTDFHVETSVENDFLGCDESHPCSLVVVPNWGGVQPAGSKPGSKQVNCSDHSGDVGLVFGDYALDNQLGQACSWSDRIVVPLHFAPTPTNCPAHNFAFAAAGAPSLSRTFDQWRSKWCGGSSDLTFDYDSTVNESLARETFLQGSGALTSSTDVAVTSEPADPGSESQRKFTYAPLVNSAISIAYHVDDQKTGQLIDNLTLNARLVAKLITQSYSLDFDCSQSSNTTKQSANCDPAVKGNPISIFDDPEFQKLNPEYPRTAFPSDSLLNRGQFLPLVVSGNSDLIHELTAWIWADPAARAFMQGKKDPWGMHVNTYYKNEPMPTDSLNVLDPGYTAPASHGVPGQSTMQVSWNPISGMDNVAASLVVDRPSSINPTLPPCGNSGVPCVYGRFGSEAPGSRALFAIVGSVDAAADRFPSAKLVNAAGKAVALTTASMKAGLAHMTTAANGVTQQADFHSTNAQQYPLTTVDYAMVPSCGLTPAKSTAIGTFLSLAAKDQTVGQLPGDLAEGAVPLTAHQRSLTTSAAKLDSSTPCPSTSTTPTGPTTSASSTPTRPAPTHTTSAPPVTYPPTEPVQPPANTGVALPPVEDTPTLSTTPATDASTSASTETTASTVATEASTSQAAFGIKPGGTGSGTGMVMPLLLIAGTLVLIGAPMGYLAVTGGAFSGGVSFAAVGRLLRRRRRGTHS